MNKNIKFLFITFVTRVNWMTQFLQKAQNILVYNKYKFYISRYFPFS